MPTPSTLPTETPTPTPRPSLTQTPTPSETINPIPCPSATTTPTPPLAESELVGVVLGPDGNPLPEVLVYAAEYGVTTTDGNGVYRFMGVLPETAVSLVFNKAGYVFDPPSITVSPGAAPEVPDCLPDQSDTTECRVINNSRALVRFINLAAKMRHLGISSTARALHTRASPRASRKLLANQVMLQSAFRNVVDTTSTLPAAAFRCPAGPRCISVDLSEEWNQPLRPLRVLRTCVVKAASNLATSRYALAAAYVARAGQYYRRAVKLMSSMPGRTDRCSVP